MTDITFRNLKANLYTFINFIISFEVFMKMNIDAKPTSICKTPFKTNQVFLNLDNKLTYYKKTMKNYQTIKTLFIICNYK